MQNATLNERERERQKADATDYKKIRIACSCLVFFQSNLRAFTALLL